jgi:hypothetical protein
MGEGDANLEAGREQDSTPATWTNPVEAVYQTVGRASTCWRSDGVFDESQAIAAAEALITYLRKNPVT